MSTITTITTPQYTLVYEVNIEVQHDTRDAYLAWLDSHTNEILALEGFLGCTVFTRAPQDEGKEDQGWSLITVQYRLNDRSSLDKYFAEHVRVFFFHSFCPIRSDLT
eukprot:GEZU01023452.1.p1 GENE.GEZU01023452.1~~GEZU01023452.1.p1  ORF type:complete len:107 (-),score=14.66 GEZU01023452.1:74-394(-)